MKENINKKRVFIIGAGASKSYTTSPTGQKMPIAKDFFQTFNKLSISSDRRVLIGDIINTAINDFGFTYNNFFNSDFDIEDFHTHVETKLISEIRKNNIPEYIQYFKAYTQLVSLFSSVINEIQNGPTSKSHLNLIKIIKSNDSIITFNWDTLLDRALSESTNWKTDYGYCIKPRKVFRNQWETPNNESNNFIKLIKLHGSTNWITSYPRPDKDNIFKLNQTTPSNELYIYENTEDPYPCWRGRFEGPYQPFSYFYYPPNILDDCGIPAPQNHLKIRLSINIPGMPEGKSTQEGTPSIPLIIPPVKNKSYSLFGNLFQTLWQTAQNELEIADEIIIIGYSFPKTDTQSISLFKSALIKRISTPTIKIIDPSPNRIINLMNTEFLIPKEKIIAYEDYFSESFDLKKITANQT